MVKCCAYNCKSDSGKPNTLVDEQGQEVIFFPFPTDPFLIGDWIENMGFHPRPNDQICSKHFGEDAFIRTTNRRRDLRKDPDEPRKLRPKAIPKFFELPPENEMERKAGSYRKIFQKPNERTSERLRALIQELEKQKKEKEQKAKKARATKTRTAPGGMRVDVFDVSSLDADPIPDKNLTDSSTPISEKDENADQGASDVRFISDSLEGQSPVLADMMRDKNLCPLGSVESRVTGKNNVRFQRRFILDTRKSEEGGVDHGCQSKVKVIPVVQYATYLDPKDRNEVSSDRKLAKWMEKNLKKTAPIAKPDFTKKWFGLGRIKSKTVMKLPEPTIDLPEETQDRILKAFFPDGDPWVYEISRCWSLKSDLSSFHLEVRVNFLSGEEALKWLEEFKEKAGVTLKFQRQDRGNLYLYRSDWICHRGTLAGGKSARPSFPGGRNTNCKMRLKLTIKNDTYAIRRHDQWAARGLRGIINLFWEHNHDLSDRDWTDMSRSRDRDPKKTKEERREEQNRRKREKRARERAERAKKIEIGVEKQGGWKRKEGGEGPKSKRMATRAGDSHDGSFEYMEEEEENDAAVQSIVEGFDMVGDEEEEEVMEEEEEMSREVQLEERKREEISYGEWFLRQNPE